MLWEKTDVDPTLVKGLSESYGVDLLTAAIMTRRGLVDAGEIKFLLEEDVRYLHNPFLFDEMEDAVDRVRQAVVEGEKVLVFGDRDVDGITSTAIVVDTLRGLGLEVSWRVPMGDDPYGLTAEAVKSFADGDGTLIITVDCGITNSAEIALAQEMGIDTVVLDHHNLPAELPPAVAIVDPKDPESSYPFDGLAGCGVALKFRQAVALSGLEIYKQPICLINLRPGNDTIIFEAIRLNNLVEVDRLVETVVPGMVRPEESRIADFVAGHHLVAYDRPVQERYLREVFGVSVEVDLDDLSTAVWEHFPALEGKSLLQIRELSRLVRYHGERLLEVDVLKNLFEVVLLKVYPGLGTCLESVSDLVALGSLGDMVPLRDENRIMIRRGIKKISEEPRPGVRKLLELQKLLGKTVTAQDVSFSVTPVINASGRLGRPDLSVNLLLSEDPKEIHELATAIVEMNKQRRKIGEDAWGQVLPVARESFERLGERLVLVVDPAIHRGITGILAGRLSRLFNAPAVVITESDGQLVGSLRTMRGVRATRFLQQFEDLFLDWGGHDGAAGFLLAKERGDELLARLSESAETLFLEAADERLSVDAELPQKYLTPELQEVVRIFGPFGQGNPPLVFMARGLKLRSVQFIGKEEQHVKLLVDAGRHKWPAVFWNGGERVGSDFKAEDTVDLLFGITTNYFQNRETLQMEIIDVRRTEA
ncbi:MAG: single-stranded-DNA-specific exonuclease RecJ [Spirochaetota bacterium]